MIEPPRLTMPVTRVRGAGARREQHAGVDGEVVDALLGLLLEHVEEQVDVEVLDLAVDLLERLVDRHGADRHGRVAQDPLPGLVDVACRSTGP